MGIIIILVNILATSAFTANEGKSMVISDRDEQRYFGLFPEIEGFVSARAFMQSDSQFLFKISHQRDGSAVDTVMVMTGEDGAELRRLIDNFEDILWTKKQFPTPLMNKHFVRKDLFGRPPLQSRVGRVVKINGEYLGQILWVSDTSLIFWRSKTKYDWRKVNLYAMSFKYSEVGVIIFEKTSRLVEYGLVGAIIGAIPGGIFGYSQGDDLTDPCLPLSAEDKACIFGTPTGLAGCLIGSIIGGLKGIDKVLDIRGNGYCYYLNAPFLRKNAVFLDLLPPELLALDH
ncbi:MAG TPA: hypothetical protein EYP58_02360 [bacterium (Candidatus Stahlbacteria)]|nr:hypothetical protein [Candidatus Stahlbacteria bacterium]